MALLQRCRRALACGLFALLDHSCWLMIQLLSGPLLLDVLQRRPWQRMPCRLVVGDQERWQQRIVWLLHRRCRRPRWGSTCLSRSLSGRLLLDLAGIANELHLGMVKHADGRKVPHAWLRDPRSGQLFTPGLNPATGAALTRL